MSEGEKRSRTKQNRCRVKRKKVSEVRQHNQPHVAHARGSVASGYSSLSSVCEILRRVEKTDLNQRLRKEGDGKSRSNIHPRAGGHIAQAQIALREEKNEGRRARREARGECCACRLRDLGGMYRHRV